MNIEFNKDHTNLLKVYFVLTVTAFHILRAVYNLPIMPSYGVVGFFIVSGYGCYLSLNSKPFKDFLKTRISYIIIPYYTALIFYTIAHFSLGFYNPNAPLKQDIWGLVTHFLFIHNFTGYTQGTISGVLWFIAPIMQLYFLSLWFKKFVDFNKYLPILVVTFIFTCSYLIKYFYNIYDLRFFGGRHIIYIAPFLSGMILAKYHLILLNLFSKIFNNIFIFIVYSVFTLFVTYKTIYSSDIIAITLTLLLSLPFLLYVCNFLEKFISTKIIPFLGLFSFFLYLYNYAFLVFYPFIHINSNFIKTLVCFLIVFVVAYLFFVLNKQLTQYIIKPKLTP